MVAADGKDAKDNKTKKTACKKKEEHDFEEDSTLVGAVADEASIEEDECMGRPDLDSAAFRSSAKASYLQTRLTSLAGVSHNMKSKELANTLKVAGYHIPHYRSCKNAGKNQ